MICFHQWSWKVNYKCGSMKKNKKKQRETWFHMLSHFYFYFCKKKKEFRTYFVYFHTFSYKFKVSTNFHRVRAACGLTSVSCGSCVGSTTNIPDNEPMTLPMLLIYDLDRYINRWSLLIGRTAQNFLESIILKEISYFWL